jgi:Mg/Co/Ni transporter MgtE
MVKRFVSIVVYQLALEAVELTEKYKMTALLVLDETVKLTGAISMRQQLQAGVVQVIGPSR